MHDAPRACQALPTRPGVHSRHSSLEWVLWSQARLQKMTGTKQHGTFAVKVRLAPGSGSSRVPTAPCLPTPLDPNSGIDAVNDVWYACWIGERCPRAHMP